MYCHKQGHENRLLVKVCFHPDCIQVACCELCINQHHLNHDFFQIPIKVLQWDFRRRDQGDIFYGSPIVKELEKIKNKLNQAIQQIEIQIKKFQQIEFQELALVKYLFDRQPNLTDQFQDLSQILDINNNSVSLKQFDRNLHDQTLYELSRINATIDLSFTKLKNQSYIKTMKCQFSQEMKHPEIEIQNGTIAKKNGNINYSIIFGQDSFDPRIDSFRFAFKILEKVNNVWIGVGADTHSEYIFGDYHTLGHHKYMVGFHKYTFHHSDQRVNHIMGIFGFDTGNIINISYDCQNKTLTFSKLHTNEYCQMILREIDLSKILYPVAWLIGRGDKVQIMHYQEQN